MLDADETLAEFMVDGQPDPDASKRALSHVWLGWFLQRGERICRSLPLEKWSLPCGKMAIAQAALVLEQLWNRLAEKHKFQLLCAYPMRLFSRDQDRESLLEICSEHSHVIPAESLTPVGDEERLHSVLLLEQKARALESEARERRKIQDALQEREAELSEFLENAVIGMHWLGPDGTILWANKSELARSGYGRDEYIGHHISEFHADRHAAEDILQRLSRHEELHGYEARLKSKDGSIHHVRIDSNVFVRDGRFVHTRCFVTDITGKREADLALFQLAAIVESSHDAIISKDLNGIIASWNRSAERVLGYKAEEIIGKSITLLIPPELLHDEVVILSKIRAGERIDHFETTRLRKNGERIDVSLTVSPVRDRQGTIIGAAKILRDITQQKQMEKTLHTSERLASVGRLAATIAHEINNPLEAITNFIYLAKQQPELCEDTRRYLSTADQELGRVAHIVQQTLGFYRDNSHASSRLVAGVLEDVLTIYQRKCLHKNLRIEQSIEPGLIVNAVQGELKQILSNLVTNAIDASPQGGRIAIRARSVGGLHSGSRGIRITIADNGAGIPPQDRAKMFAPFFTTKKEVGTGLGLWISKDLLEKRGGDIRVRSSNSGRTGTVMSIYLPSEFQPTGPSAL